MSKFSAMQLVVLLISLPMVWTRLLDNELFLSWYTDDNKTRIAKSGALMPLTRLARSKDMRVQRNATGALLNMTHSGSFPCPH